MFETFSTKYLGPLCNDDNDDVNVDVCRKLLTIYKISNKNLNSIMCKNCYFIILHKKKIHFTIGPEKFTIIKCEKLQRRSKKCLIIQKRLNIQPFSDGYLFYGYLMAS